VDGCVENATLEHRISNALGALGLILLGSFLQGKKRMLFRVSSTYKFEVALL